jgi:Tfp pilus assembly protein PilF
MNAGVTASDVHRLFAQAEQAFAAGRDAEAASLLARVRQINPTYVAALHVSALVAKRQRQLADARQFFDQALRLAPADPAILTNAGNLLGETGKVEAAMQLYARAMAADARFVPARLARASLLQRIGRLDEALGELKVAEELQPGSAQINSMRGGVLVAAGRFGEARAAYRDALQLEPTRLPALVGAATAAMQMGDSDAPELLRRALQLRPGDPQLTLQLAEALEAEGHEDATSSLEAAVARNPDWLQGQLTLARMRWEAGDSGGFVRTIERRLSEEPRSTPMWEALAMALATADRHADAAAAARAGQQAVGAHPGLLMIEAVESSEAGDTDNADRAFAQVPAAMPGIRIAQARHRLRTRDLERAQEQLDAAFAEDRWDITGWALQGILWRFAGDPQNGWLHEQPGLVAAHDLPLAPEAIGRIADRLRSLHQTKSHPLGQSLRGGTQTRGRLFERQEPEIRQLRAAIEETLAKHWFDLPALDPAHPLLRHRGGSPKLDGSWSVRLTDGGFHVAHIHPHGVISSACYFVVPDAGEEGEGYLEVGGAPPELGLELGPLQSFAPAPGRIVLFPSTMYHSTRPFRAGERLTAAFDVVMA